MTLTLQVGLTIIFLFSASFAVGGTCGAETKPSKRCHNSSVTFAIDLAVQTEPPPSFLVEVEREPNTVFEFDTPVLNNSAPVNVIEAEQRLRELIGNKAYQEDLRLEGKEKKEKLVAPDWEPAVSQFAIKGYRIKKCCISALRATRLAAEGACRALGKKVWSVKSERPKEIDPPLRFDGSCAIYEVIKNKKTHAYSCMARAVAKCIVP